MSEDEVTFYRGFHDRSHQYPGGGPAPERRFAITAAPAFVATPAGRAAAYVTALLLAKMTKRVVLELPDLPTEPSAPWRGRTLTTACAEDMRLANPFLTLQLGEAGPDDYRFHLGPDGADWVVHGDAWSAYVGPAPSPIVGGRTSGELGAAFAAISAVGRAFAEGFPPALAPRLADLVSWDSRPEPDLPSPRGAIAGEVWVVGAGSVGSAVAFFLALAGLDARVTLFDADPVKLENLSRSPIFNFRDIGQLKVDVTRRFLKAAGLDATAEDNWLDQSEIWRRRQQGTPDILVSAANERNVRYLIETQLPPVQIYGTTGKNWQSTVLRHVPLRGACSCCVFGADPPAATDCARGETPSPDGGKPVDAALPFLSFAAGLMTVAEIAKVALGYGEAGVSRALFLPRGAQLVARAPLLRAPECVCRDRDDRLHVRMLEGSRFASLSS